MKIFDSTKFNFAVVILLYQSLILSFSALSPNPFKFIDFFNPFKFLISFLFFELIDKLLNLFRILWTANLVYQLIDRVDYKYLNHCHAEDNEKYVQAEGSNDDDPFEEEHIFVNELLRQILDYSIIFIYILTKYYDKI